jgi:hypothetical protein
MSYVKNEDAHELYPDLIDYLDMFDLEHSVTYAPAPATQIESDSKEAYKSAQWKKTLIQVGLILMVAAIIVFIFIFIGITALPEVTP